MIENLIDLISIKKSLESIIYCHAGSCPDCRTNLQLNNNQCPMVLYENEVIKAIEALDQFLYFKSESSLVTENEFISILTNPEMFE